MRMNAGHEVFEIVIENGAVCAYNNVRFQESAPDRQGPGYVLWATLPK